MRHRTLAALLVVLGLAASSRSGAQAISPAEPAWVPVATYENDAAHEAQVARIRAALEAHHLQSVTTCTGGCQLSIDARRFGEAYRIVHETIEREHLDVHEMPVITS